MLFLQNYWLYNQCYEIPRNFSNWSAMALLAATVHRKVYIRQGDIIHHCNIYACLVAEQGDKKSTAKDFARDTYTELFPTGNIAASVQSREDIARYLASDEAAHVYRDENGVLIECRPFALFVNELKNFLSFNIGGMIDFLTDIYDRKYFDASTIKRGLEKVPNVCVTMLACETPGWIIDKLKLNLITGGFSRRCIYVYERLEPNDPNTPCIPRPQITDQARKAWQDVKRQLLDINKIVGEFTWTKDAEKFFDAWYRENKRNLPSDPVMRGYRKTLDVQLLKVCMLLAICFPTPKLEMTVPLLELGLAFLEAIAKNMPELSVAAGRNELAVPMHNMLRLLEERGGSMPEKVLLRETEKDLGVMEQLSIIRHLCDTDRIVKFPVVVSGVRREMIYLRALYDEGVRTGKIKPASSPRVGQPPPSAAPPQSKSPPPGPS